MSRYVIAEYKVQVFVDADAPPPNDLMDRALNAVAAIDIGSLIASRLMGSAKFDDLLDLLDTVKSWGVTASGVEP